MFSAPEANLAYLDVTDGMKVADLGAGTGYYAIAAGRRVGSSGRVYAVEVQKDLLNRLRSAATAEGVRNVEVIWGNIEKIGGTKLKEGIADRAILANVLFQIAPGDRDGLALEAKRILKPGGKILVVDWAGGPLSPKGYVPRMAAETLFQKNGFALQKSFMAGDHHYGLVFIKS